MLRRAYYNAMGGDGKIRDCTALCFLDLGGDTQRRQSWADGIVDMAADRASSPVKCLPIFANDVEIARRYHLCTPLNSRLDRTTIIVCAAHTIPQGLLSRPLPLPIVTSLWTTASVNTTTSTADLLQHTSSAEHVPSSFNTSPDVRPALGLRVTTMAVDKPAAADSPCPDPSVHDKHNRLSEQASTAALYVTNPNTKSAPAPDPREDVLDSDGKLSSKSAFASSRPDQSHHC